MEDKFENLEMYLLHKKSIGERSEVTLFNLSKVIDKCTTAFYRKKRNSSFTKPEKLAIYTKVNKHLATEDVINKFFEKPQKELV